MAPDRWVTLRDVYRSTFDPERIERKIAEVEALVDRSSGIRIASADLAARTAALAAWPWDDTGGGVVRTAADPDLREQSDDARGRIRGRDRRSRRPGPPRAARRRAALVRAGLARHRPEAALQHH